MDYTFDAAGIAEQRAVCDAATGGEWERVNKSVRVKGTLQHYPWGPEAPSGHQGGICNCLGSSNDKDTDAKAKANALFIALSRTAYPAALTEIERLHPFEAENAALRAQVASLTRERDAAVCDMFGCMSTQGQCVRCKKRYYCDGTDDDKFSPLCKNNSHCYAWEWRGLHADNTDAPTGAESEGDK